MLICFLANLLVCLLTFLLTFLINYQVPSFLSLLSCLLVYLGTSLHVYLLCMPRLHAYWLSCVLACLFVSFLVGVFASLLAYLPTHFIGFFLSCFLTFLLSGFLTFLHSRLASCSLLLATCYLMTFSWKFASYPGGRVDGWGVLLHIKVN